MQKTTQLLPYGDQKSSTLNPKSLLYAIDANGIANWLWHARCESGETTLAEATATWLEEFKKAVRPTHVALFFDGRNNWRYAAYAEYKSARKAKPKDEVKIAALRDNPGDWMSLGIMPLTCEGFEADDCIASVCESYDGPIIIVSSDKDMMQLVSDRVKQYDPRPNKEGRNLLYGPDEVEEKLGVPPFRVSELLAIMGDSADSIPGVTGWGKVRAVNAIKQTKSLPELLRKASRGELKDIDAKHQATLAKESQQLSLYLRLTDLRTDAPVPSDIETYKVDDETKRDDRIA